MGAAVLPSTPLARSLVSHERAPHADCTVAWQLSRSECVSNKSFHCTPMDRGGRRIHELTVHSGCRAWFVCGDSLVQCGDWRQGDWRQAKQTCWCGESRRVNDVSHFLSMYISEEYSRRLYGGSGVGAGALDVNTADVILLDLLQPRALRAIADVGTCRMDGSAARPFFWNGLPRDAVWVQRSQPPRVYANHSWVEVVHCAFPETGEIANRSYHGTYSAFWTYAAVGSGVSMNIGRTTVARSYGSAVAMATARPRVAAFGNSGPFDTIQINNHEEFHSTRQLRNEIIFLNAGRDTTTFDELIEAGVDVRCGREGSWLQCSQAMLALYRRDVCDPMTAPYTKPLLAGFENAARDERCVTRDRAQWP